MEFLTLMKETDSSIEFRKTYHELFNDMSYEDYGTRKFEHIQLPRGIKLSVLACSGTYCMPRKTFMDLTKYTAMELGIFKNNELVNAKRVISNRLLALKLEEYYDGSVYAYVPVELIEELYQELKRMG